MYLFVTPLSFVCSLNPMAGLFFRFGTVTAGARSTGASVLLSGSVRVLRFSLTLVVRGLCCLPLRLRFP